MKLCSLLFLILFSPLLPAATSTDADFPLGPVGGTFRITTGQPFARVTAVSTSMPGERAGLRVGDFITGTDGTPFSATGEIFQGVTRQLGWAIEQAEATDGMLSLDVLRAGVGKVTLQVDIGASGALSPAFPLNSPKWQTQTASSLTSLNERLVNSDDNALGYITGWAGLALLATPTWNDTIGDTPYRLGINRAYSYYKAVIEKALYSPVEMKLFDGTDNPNFVPETRYLENWGVGLGTMFLSEYYAKTRGQDPAADAETLALLQEAAEKIGNRIQWWHQPQGRAEQDYTTLRPGITAHHGVTGDYMDLTFGGGINIVGVHLSGGLAMAKRAGVDMSVAPIDGRYFGYDPLLFDDDPANDPSGQSLPAGLTVSDNGRKVDIKGTIKDFLPSSTTFPDLAAFADDLVSRQPTLDEKLEMVWSFYKRSQSSEIGYVTYSPGTGSRHDAYGRTLGALFTASQLESAGRTFVDRPGIFTDDAARLNLLRDYPSVDYDRFLDIHATNIQGPAFFFLAQSQLSTRQRQHQLDNWRFFYNLMRENRSSPVFMRGRSYGEQYVDHQTAAEVYFSLAQGIASGGLDLIDGYDTARQLLVDFSRVPHLEWKDISTRTLRTAATSLTLDLEVTDGAGVPATDYVVSWRGPAGVTFSDPNSLKPTITARTAGKYDLMLTVQDRSGLVSTQEPIAVTFLPDHGSGYRGGVAEYKVYRDVSGTTLTELTESPKFPNSPDEVVFLNSLEGTATGDNFGASLTTLIVAPETGTYQFYIVSDDQGSLLFNENGESPSGAVEIASVPTWASSGDWTKFPSQRSAEITLNAGEKYYLHALMKEGSGGEPLEIGWTTPSDSRIRIIDSSALALPLASEAAAITSQPGDMTLSLGDPFTLDATVTGPEPRLFQWLLNGEPYASPQTSPTLEITNTHAYLAGRWQLVYTTEDEVITSDEITVAIDQVGTLTAGALWQEVYFNISGETIADLTESSSYPFSPDVSGALSEASSGTLGDNYGQRWTGWIIPRETARYRFYGAADDHFTLSLSPTELRSHLQEILQSTRYTEEGAFSQRPPSEWIELEAGQRYAIEFLHKEGSGGDHAVFTWQKEGDPVPEDGSGGLSSAFLQHRSGGPDPNEDRPPFAADDALTVLAGAQTLLPVLENDLDENLSTLRITGLTSPSQGTASLTADGKHISFHSPADASGQITLTYTVTNEENLSAQATLTINLRNLSEGLALHYEFEDLQNGAIDSTGNTRNGTIGGTLSTGPDEILGATYHVDAADDTITLDPDVLDDINDEITVSFWMKPTEFTGNEVRVIQASNTVAQTEPIVLRYPWFELAVLDTDDDDSADEVQDRIVLFDGVEREDLLDQWSHVVFTKNTVTGTSAIYVDGEALLEGRDLFEPIGTTDRFHFGGFASFRGQLDDLRIYDRALSAAEIGGLFQLPGKPSVNLTASGNFIMENSNEPILYTLTRDGSPTGDLTVYLQVTGSATDGSDYEALSRSITIPAGSAESTFDLDPIDDLFGETTETVRIQVLEHSTYVVSGTAPLVRIGSDELPRMDFMEIDPEAGTLRFRFAPGTQLTIAPGLEYSTTLRADDWNLIEEAPQELENDILQHQLPVFPQSPEALFFRWRLE